MIGINCFVMHSSVVAHFQTFFFRFHFPFIILSSREINHMSSRNKFKSQYDAKPHTKSTKFYLVFLWFENIKYACDRKKGEKISKFGIPFVCSFLYILLSSTNESFLFGIHVFVSSLINGNFIFRILELNQSTSTLVTDMQPSRKADFQCDDMTIPIEVRALVLISCIKPNNTNYE